MQLLTPKQQQVLDFISAYLKEYGSPPTLREISDEIGVQGTATAISHLNALERKGFVQRRSTSRGISLPHFTSSSITVPILGTVRAGIPELASEDVEGYINLDPSWMKGSNCYLLRVKGNSMIDAHICNGDLALIRPQSTADNGQIVVALIDGEATLKRFYHEAGQIRLQPENSSMEPIIIKEGQAETIIAGILLRTIRSYE